MSLKVSAGGSLLPFGAILRGRVTMSILGLKNWSQKQAVRQAGLKCEMKMVLGCQLGFSAVSPGRDSISFNAFNVIESFSRGSFLPFCGYLDSEGAGAPHMICGHQAHPSLLGPKMAILLHFFNRTYVLTPQWFDTKYSPKRVHSVWRNEFDLHTTLQSQAFALSSQKNSFIPPP